MLVAEERGTDEISSVLHVESNYKAELILVGMIYKQKLVSWGPAQSRCDPNRFVELAWRDCVPPCTAVRMAAIAGPDTGQCC